MAVSESPRPPVAGSEGGSPLRDGPVGLLARLASPSYRRALGWAVPLLVLAYGFAMANFTLAGDDWFALFPESTLDTRYALVAGRWMMPVTWLMLGNGSFVPFFTFAIALALLVLAALIASAAWGFERSWAVLAVVGLFVVNPLFTDTLSFKQHHLSYPIGMVCAVTAGWLVLRRRGSPLPRVAAAAGLLVVALACYQPTALAFAVVLLGGEASRASSRGSGYRGEAGRRWLEVLAAVVAGVAVYLFSVRVAWWVTGADPLSVAPNYRLNEGYPSTPGEIAAALREGFRMVGRFWFGSTALYPIVLKVGQLVLSAAGILAAAAPASRLRGASWRGRLGAWAWVGLLGLGSLVVPFAVVFLRELPSTRGNVLTTVGLAVGFWGGLLLDRGHPSGPERRARVAHGIVVALVLVALAGCAYEVNKGYFGLYLSNQRDLANATRMLSVMEQMPEFGQGRRIKVELVGTVSYAFPDAPFTDLAGPPGQTIVNVSGLAHQNRLVNMLNLVGGGAREFVVRPVSGDPAVQAVLTTMPSWPEPGSIRFLEGVFVVKGS